MRLLLGDYNSWNGYVVWLSKFYVQVLTSSAFIQNWQGLYACRLLTGFFEAGLIPCINVYIALVYKKSERGKRSALIFAFSAFSSAFGGLLAYGLTQVHGPNGWEGWRWLFAIEGAMTLILVAPFLFRVPKTSHHCLVFKRRRKEHDSSPIRQ
jgi:Arabinose efflux permease